MFLISSPYVSTESEIIVKYALLWGMFMSCKHMVFQGFLVDHLWVSFFLLLMNCHQTFNHQNSCSLDDETDRGYRGNLGGDGV